MDVIDRLIAAFNASGMKQSHVARVTGMSKSKLNKILKRNQQPTVLDFVAIAAAIGLEPGRLFSDGEVIMELRALRSAIAATQDLQNLLTSYLPESAAAPPLSLRKPAQNRMARPLRVAASSNVELYPEVEKKRQRIPRDSWNRGARMVARAIGDSMTGPDGIANDEFALVKPTTNLRAAKGNIVVIRVGEAVYLKKLEVIGSTLHLVSINPEHETIVLDEAAKSDAQLIGVVVDRRKSLA
jgi:SOS-response transcriptional repressor LexA